ncbi:uncharacterized protein LOC110980930 [Acanthaster planci]|uniref:Uncharacterized protein LOC110980930 n=1 Tax=Acanthaster planci TaxID=133434 RepID=A0A8B7YKB8_ACAPL|nr:uncharacterized protein LOC110980930 [Acanthaster planci]XP_022093713.1 uncharacterized protein LOC110980930 [Acanthaster planci]
MAAEMKKHTDNSNGSKEKIPLNQTVLSSVSAVVEESFQEASAAARFQNYVGTAFFNDTIRPCQREQILVAVREVIGNLFWQACVAARAQMRVEDQSFVKGVKWRNDIEEDTVAKSSHASQSYGHAVGNSTASEQGCWSSSLFQLNSVSRLSCEESLQTEETSVAMETFKPLSTEITDPNEMARDDLKQLRFLRTVSEKPIFQDSRESKNGQCITKRVDDREVSQDSKSKTVSNSLMGQKDALDCFKGQEMSAPWSAVSFVVSSVATPKDDISPDLAQSRQDEPLCKILKLDEKSCRNCSIISLKSDTDREWDQPTLKSSENFNSCYDRKSDKALRSTPLTLAAREETPVPDECFEDTSSKGIQALSSVIDISQKNVTCRDEKTGEHIPNDISIKEETSEVDYEMPATRMALQDVGQKLQLTRENEEDMHTGQPDPSAELDKKIDFSLVYETVPPEPTRPIDDDYKHLAAEKKQASDADWIKLEGPSEQITEEVLPENGPKRGNVKPTNDQMVPSLLEEDGDKTPEDRAHELYADDDEEVSIEVKHREADVTGTSLSPTPSSTLNEVNEEQLNEEVSGGTKDRSNAVPIGNQLVPQTSTGIFQWRHGISYENQQPASSRSPLGSLDQQTVPDLEWRPSPLPACNRKRRLGLSRRQRVSHLHHINHLPCQNTRPSPNTGHEE